jgi:hypothetical protein
MDTDGHEKKFSAQRPDPSATSPGIAASDLGGLAAGRHLAADQGFRPRTSPDGSPGYAMNDPEHPRTTADNR